MRVQVGTPMNRGEHAHGPGDLASVRRRALTVALVANAIYLLVEVVGGVAFGSLALLADAAHMVSDVVALSIALVAQILVTRPPSDRHTYGFVRAEVLAAQVNGLLLLVAAVAIGVDAVRRLGDPVEVDGVGVLVVGVLGLVVNGGSAWVVGRAAHGSLNLRGALWHLVSDALGSVGVVVVGLGALVWGADRLDPLISIGIALLILVAAWRLLRDATRVLLEGVPVGLDVGEIRDALAGAPGVEAVHHLHVWSLASETPALSAHVLLAGSLSLHDAQERSGELKALLAERFDITHATLETECHLCVDEDPAQGDRDDSEATGGERSVESTRDY